MTGTHDHLVNSVNSFNLNKILSPKEFRVFEYAGHLINDECEEEFSILFFLFSTYNYGVERFVKRTVCLKNRGLFLFVRKHISPPIFGVNIN